MKADSHTGKDVAKYLGVSRATLYRYLGERIGCHLVANPAVLRGLDIS